MSEHKALVTWERKTPDFQYDTYDRSHETRFGGGEVLRCSSAPEYLGRAERVNPEEMLAAALASCHMLTFLAVAAKSRLVVDSYSDDSSAYLEKNAQGKLAVTRVVLRPRVKLQAPVDAEKFASMHHKAHANCFIAHSVSCDVQVEAVQT